MSDKAYNLDQLREIAEGNEEFIVEMVQLFIINTRMVLTDLKAQIEERNSEKVSKLAHSIKPNMNTYGIPGAAEKLIFIEKEGAPAGQWELVSDSYSKVHTLVEQAILQMEKDFKLS